MSVVYFKVKKLYYRLFPSELLYKKDLKYFKNCDNILDIGCGKGFFASLSPKRIVGLEYNPKLVNICKSKDLNVIEGNCLNLPFKSKSFDGVYCSHLLEHFIPEDVFKLANEIGRILKERGVVVIKTPLPNFSFWNDPTHVKPYPPPAIFSIFNVVELGQPTEKGKYKFEFVDMKFGYHSLYRSYIKPSVNPRKYWFYTIWRGISKFSRLKLPLRDSVTIVLRKK